MQNIPTPVYYGNSMRGVFAAGEHLELEKIAFADLQIGDVVAVHDPQKGFYVHRVIDIKGSAAVTLGDNNAAPDELKITIESAFFLVRSAVDSQGRHRKIAGGKRGMLEFCRHQYGRRIRLTGSMVLLKAERFFFWRREVETERVFGTEICYYFRGKPVARRNAAGQIVYRNWRKRLLFKVTCGVKHAIQD